MMNDLGKSMERRADQILKNIDDLWNHSKDKGWFDQIPEYRNYLMWIEHEVSRAASLIKADAKHVR